MQPAPNEFCLMSKLWTPRANGHVVSSEKRFLLPKLPSRHLRIFAIVGSVLITLLIYAVFFTHRYPPYYRHYPRTGGSPFMTDPNEDNEARGGGQTRVIFNYHEPVEVNSPSIQHIDLNTVMS